MSNNIPQTPVSTTVLMACATILFCFVTAAVVVVFLAVPEGANTGSLIAILTGQLAPTLATLFTLVKLSTVQVQVRDVATDTDKLANGYGDAKIREAVADVLPEHMVDPAVRQQIELARTRRVTPS